MEAVENKTIFMEEQGINIKNEKSLHAAIKKWYALPGDRFEVKTGSFIIDIVRDGLWIEIQTKNFSAMARKLHSLVEKGKVRVVYPIAIEKWITTLEIEATKKNTRRKSPKKGKVLDLFQELIRIPQLMNHENFSLEVLLVKAEEIRCRDGKGSYRRRGVSMVDTKLLEVCDRILFTEPEDLVSLLPSTLKSPFTNKILSESLGYPLHNTRKITYCLKKMELILEVGKQKNELLFQINTGKKASR